MKKIENICFISAGYPSPKSNSCIFLDKLIMEIVDLGVNCTVIVPNSISKVLVRNDKHFPELWEKTTIAGNRVEIRCPKYLSYSSKNILGYSTERLTLASFKQAVFKEFKKLKKKPDAVYGHFISPSGIVASDIGAIYNIPSFFAYGEGAPYSLKTLGLELLQKSLAPVSGVISVSSRNKEILLDEQIISMAKQDRIGVFPNGSDLKTFYPRDKAQMREKYGFNRADYIVISVGAFIPSKGTRLLSQALDMCGDVKAIFLGAGPDVPYCKNIIFSGVVGHDVLPELLSAADIFVLPTLEEGCCNAIIEAMACGLPIVSADRSFNDDIIDETNSIRIEPTNVYEIRDAILLLQADPERREKMAAASLRHAQRLNLNNRARNILSFMESALEQEK